MASIACPYYGVLKKHLYLFRQLRQLIVTANSSQFASPLPTGFSTASACPKTLSVLAGQHAK